MVCDTAQLIKSYDRIRSAVSYGVSGCAKADKTGSELHDNCAAAELVGHLAWQSKGGNPHGLPTPSACACQVVTASASHEPGVVGLTVAVPSKIEAPCCLSPDHLPSPRTLSVFEDSGTSARKLREEEREA